MPNLITLQFDGIGTHWWIKLPEDTSSRLVSVVEQKLLNELGDFDRKYSRFKETSLISKLNFQKVLQNFPKELYEMLVKSEQIREISEGAFDVCVGTHLENLGYDKNYSFKKTNQTASKFLKIVELSEDKVAISKDTIVDLGGIGKGWLIEKFTKILYRFDLDKFIINGGGDIYVFDKSNIKYQYALENPFDNSEMIGTIKISNEAIACSSPSRRAWRDKKSGEVNHHLVNFKTGKSEEDVIAVFTQSKSIVNADLASTAIFVSDLNLSAKIADALNVEYLIVFPDRTFKKSKNYKGVLNK